MERRLAAILAADVAGYTRLMGEDETGTHRAFKTHRQELIGPSTESHHGRIVKSRGDGVLAEFASVIDAVECAVEIQKEMNTRNAQVPEDRRIELRIGINMSDVIVDDGDIFGAGVNLAARLEGFAEPGGICMSADAYRQVRNKLDLPIEDLGERRLKNIREPVRTYRVLLDPQRRRRASTRISDLPDNPSIAVLPLDDLSTGQEQPYLADAISQDIMTELSRFTQLCVVARHPTCASPDKAALVRRIGKDLGVSYVLDGSIQRSGERVRMTIQLMDASNGQSVWAERFDSKLQDTFAVQDEITQKVVSMLGEAVWQDAATKLALKRPENFRAYDFALRGMEYLHRINPDDNRRARAFFREALELEADLPIGHQGVAWSFLLPWAQGWEEGEEEPLQKALGHAQKLAEVDPNNAHAYRTLGRVNLALGRYEVAPVFAERALDLNPNDGDIIGNYGVILLFSGKKKEAVPWFKKVLALHPHTPHMNWIYKTYLALAYFMDGRYETAVATVRDLGEIPLTGRRILAACYACLERTDEAGAEAAAILRSVPCFRLSRFGEVSQFQQREDRDHYLGALRKAGLPE